MNTHHSRMTSKRSQNLKLNHAQAEELAKKINKAHSKGREAARDPNECALIPNEYHAKPDEGDAWFNGFMEERKSLTIA